jgi:hypothetical protein
MSNVAIWYERRLVSGRSRKGEIQMASTQRTQQMTTANLKVFAIEVFDE